MEANQIDSKKTEKVKLDFKDSKYATGKRKTSIAKMIAAIGALKMDDMAPAAAQPINRVLEAWFIKKILEILEPSEAPVATVGPSNPTEPPKPTVMGAVITEAYIWKRFMIPFWREIAYKVVGIPWPTFFLKI